MRPSDDQTLQPLGDETDPIPPREPDRIEEEILGARGGKIPPMMVPKMPTRGRTYET